MSLESSVILAALASQDDAVTKQVLSSCDPQSQEYLSHAFDLLTSSNTSNCNAAISADTALAKLAAMSAKDVFRLFSTVDELYLFGDTNLDQDELDDDEDELDEHEDYDESDEVDDSDEDVDSEDDDSDAEFDDEAVDGSDYAPYAALANSICTFALYSNKLTNELIALCSAALNDEDHLETCGSLSKQRILRFLTALILCARKLSQTGSAEDQHSSMSGFGFDSAKAQAVIERIEALLENGQSALNLDDEESIDWLPEERIQELLRHVSASERVKLTLKLSDSNLWVSLLAEHGLTTLHSANCAHLSLLAECPTLRFPDSDDVISLRYSPYLAATNADTAADADADTAADAAAAAIGLTSSVASGLSAAAGAAMHVNAGQIAKLERLNTTKLVIGRNLAIFDRVLPKSLLYVDLNELEELLCFRRPQVLACIRELASQIAEQSQLSAYSIDADSAELIVLACLLQHHDEEWFEGFSCSSQLLQSICESDNGASLRYLCDCFKAADLSDHFAKRILSYLYETVEIADEEDADSADVDVDVDVDVDADDAAETASATADADESWCSPFAQALRESFKERFKVSDEISLRLRLENSIILAPKSLWRALDEAVTVDFMLSDARYQPFSSKLLESNPLLNEALNPWLAELAASYALRPAFISDVIKIGMSASRSIFRVSARKIAQYTSLSHDVNEYCDKLFRPYVDRSQIDATKSILCCDLDDIAKLKSISPELMLKSTMYLVGYSRELLNHSFNLKVLSEPIYLQAIAVVDPITAMHLSSLADKYSLVKGEPCRVLLELISTVTASDDEADAATTSFRDADAATASYRDADADTARNGGASFNHSDERHHGQFNSYVQEQAMAATGTNVSDDEWERNFRPDHHGHTPTSDELFGDWGSDVDSGFGNKQSIRTINADDLAYEEMDYERSMESDLESNETAARNARGFNDTNQEDCDDLTSADIYSLDNTLVVEKVDTHRGNQCIVVYRAELNPILKELLYIFGDFIFEVSVPDVSVYSAADKLESQEDEPFTVNGVELSEVEIEETIVAKGQSIRDGSLEAGANLAIELSLVKTPSDDDDATVEPVKANMLEAFKRNKLITRDVYSERMLSYYQASQLKLLQRIINSKRNDNAIGSATVSDASYASSVSDASSASCACADAHASTAAACSVDAVYIIAYDKDIVSTAALCRALKLNVLTVSLESIAAGRTSLESVALAAGVHDLSSIAVVLDNVCLHELLAISPLIDVLSSYAPENMGKDGADKAIAHSGDNGRSSAASAGASAYASAGSGASADDGAGYEAVLYPHLSAVGQHILKLKRAKNYGVGGDRSYSASAYYYGDNSLAAMIEGCMALIKASAGSLCGCMQVFCIDPNLTLRSSKEDDYFNSHDRYRPSHYVDLPLFDDEADRNAMLKLVKNISGDAASYETHQALSKLDLFSQNITADDAQAAAARAALDARTALAAAQAAASAAQATASATHDANAEFEASTAFSALQDDAGMVSEFGAAKSGLGSYEQNLFAGNVDSILSDDENALHKPSDDYDYCEDDDSKALEHRVITALDLGPDDPRGLQEIETAMKAISNMFIGGHEWRSYQAEALPQILSKRNDYLISIPTGGGKSVLFQGPALYRSHYSRKLSLVISPLRALILDQIIELRNKGFTAADYLSGDRSSRDTQESFDNIISGRTQILYITPERFRSRKFFSTICQRFERDGGAEYIVFDEAHCISQWGKEFRPDYLNAANLCKLLRTAFPLSIIMCSATMTNQVSAELSAYMLNPMRLGEDEQNYNPIRDHIEIRMQQVDKEFDSRISAIMKFIRSENIDFSKSRMLIFCPTRKLCQEVSSALNFEAKKAALKDRSYRQSAKQHHTHNAIIDMAGHVDYFHAAQSAATRKNIYERYKPDYAKARNVDADLAVNDSLLMQLKQSGEFTTEELSRVVAEHGKTKGNPLSEHDQYNQYEAGDEQDGTSVHESNDELDSLFTYDDSDADEMHSKGPVYVLCSTKAFGMGMDIPNIHYLVHFSPPAVFEDYLQEVGRAGRDMAAYHAAFPNGRKLPALCLYNPDDFEKANEQMNNSLISWNEIINSDNTLRTYIQQFKSLKEATASPVMTPIDVLDRNIERILNPNIDRNAASDSTRNRLIFSTLESIGRIRMQFSGMCPIPVRINLKNLHAYLNQAQIVYSIATGNYNYGHNEDAASIIESLPPLAIKAIEDNTAQSIEIEPVISPEHQSELDYVDSLFDDVISSDKQKKEQQQSKEQDKANKIHTTCAAKTVWTQGKLSNRSTLLNTLKLGKALADAVDNEVTAAAITLDRINAKRAAQAIAKAKAASAVDATIAPTADSRASDAANRAASAANASAANASTAAFTANASAATSTANADAAYAAAQENTESADAVVSEQEEDHTLGQRTLDTKVNKSGTTSMHKVERLGGKVDRNSLIDLMSKQLIDIGTFASANNMFSNQAINTLIELMQHDAVDISAPFSMKLKPQRQYEINYFFKDAYDGCSTDENYLLKHLPTISLAVKVLRTVLSNAHKHYIQELRRADESIRFERNRSPLNSFVEHYYQNSDQAAACQAPTPNSYSGAFGNEGLSDTDLELMYGNGDVSTYSHTAFAERMAQLHSVDPNYSTADAQDYITNQDRWNRHNHGGFNIDANYLITRKKCYEIIADILRPLIADFPKQKIIVKKADIAPNGVQIPEESKTILVMPWAEQENKESFTAVESYLKVVTRNVFKLISQIASYLPDIHVRYNQQQYHDAGQASALLLEVKSDAFHLFLDVMQDDLVSLIELIQNNQVEMAKSSRTVQSDIAAFSTQDNKTGLTPIGERLSASALDDDDDDVTIYINAPSSADNNAKSSDASSSSYSHAHSINAAAATDADSTTAATDAAIAAATADSSTTAATAPAATTAIAAPTADGSAVAGRTTVGNEKDPTIKNTDDYSHLFDVDSWHNNWCAVILKLGLMHNDASELLDKYELSNSRKSVSKDLPKLADRLYGYGYFKFLLDSLNTLNFVSSSTLLSYGIEVFTAPDSMTPMDSGESQDSKFYKHRKNFDMLEQFKRLRINIMSLFCMEIPAYKRNQFIESVFKSTCLQDLDKSIKEHSDPNGVAMQQITAHALEIEEDKLSENAEQWAIYQAPYDTNINVMAGPGSGKTHVLTMRVARLIYREHVDPESILVLAYNRAVVFELKERLSTLFSNLRMSRVGRRIKVYTFHGLAKRCLKDCSRGVDTAHWEHVFADKLTNEPQLFSSLFPRIEYILIDEFQDITSTRLEILKIIRTQLNNIRLFTIGDINQSIYGFDRINQPQDAGMKTMSISPAEYAKKLSPLPYYGLLDQQFKPITKSMSLNYRSYQRILDEAAQFLTDDRFLPQTAPNIQVFAPEHEYVFMVKKTDPNEANYWYNIVPMIIDFALQMNEQAARLFKDGDALITEATEEESRRVQDCHEHSKSNGRGKGNGDRQSTSLAANESGNGNVDSQSSSFAANESDLGNVDSQSSSFAANESGTGNGDRQSTSLAANESDNSTNANDLAGVKALSSIIADKFDDAIPEFSPVSQALEQQTAAAQAQSESDAQIAMSIRNSDKGANFEQIVDNLDKAKELKEKGEYLRLKGERTKIKSIAIMFRTNAEVYNGLSKIRRCLNDKIQLRIQGNSPTECYREIELYEIAHDIYRRGDCLCVTNVAAPEALSSTSNTDAYTDEADISSTLAESALPFADIQSAHAVSQITTAQEYKHFVMHLMQQHKNWDPVLLDVAYCIVLSFFEQWQDSDRPARFNDLYEYYTDVLRRDDGGQIWKLYEHYSDKRILKEERLNLILTTMHKVKGLEFDLVVVTPSEASLPLIEHNNVENPDGFSRRRFPNVNDAIAASSRIPLSQDEKADIEEERRLYYVAYTRARKYLYAYQEEREIALANETRYINANEKKFEYVVKSPDLKDYIIGFTAAREFFEVNEYIRHNVSRNQPVFLEMVQKQGRQGTQLVCNVLHQIDKEHRPVIIGRLSSNNPIFMAMQRNNVYRLSGLFISNIIAWSYEDTCESDKRRLSEYEEKTSQGYRAYKPRAYGDFWCDEAKRKGFVYVILLAGVGQPA